MVNKGTRPAKDTLVTIAAKGNFHIQPRQCIDDHNDNGEQHDEETTLSLPFPPQPPKGRWTTNFMDVYNLYLRPNSKLGALIKGISKLNQSSSTSDQMAPWLSAIGPSKLQRDPNAFYYKSGSPKAPVKLFSLECKQWRHAIDKEYFEGELYLARNAHEVQGALECRIQAANLSIPVKK